MMPYITNQKIDRRVIKTKKAIFEAFEALLQEVGLEKITISSLARKAHIDRKTFYLHYNSIDDMLDDMAHSMVCHLLDETSRDLQAILRRKDLDRLERGCNPKLLEWQLLFYNVNIAIKQSLPKGPMNRDTCLLIEVLFERFKGPLKKEIYARNMLSRDIPDDLLTLYVTFVISGVLGVYSSWLSDGQKLPLQTVSAVAESMLFKGLGSLDDCCTKMCQSNMAATKAPKPAHSSHAPIHHR